jgi:CheY-like chemotaxis protein
VSSDGTPARPLIVQVDDNESDLELMRLALTELVGNRVRYIGLNDGDQALTFFRELMRPPSETVALILLDINVPRISGWDLAARLRADATMKDIPVVMLSGSRANRDQARARELAVDYLTKPGTFTEFMQALKALFVRYGLLPAGR